MRRFYSVFVILFMCSCGGESADNSTGIGIYSQGIRMGLLEKASIKGNFNDSVEGQLNLGREGTQLIEVTGSGDDKVEIQINPWRFSSGAENFDTFDSHLGNYVVISYNQANVVNSMKYDTDYYAYKISAITRKYPFEEYISQSGEPTSGVKSRGRRIGRIVKVSSKGAFNKTYEIMIQQGNSGNKFKKMSCSGLDMYSALVAAAMSGKSYIINYVEYTLNLSLRDTPYEIWKIEKVRNDL